MAATRCALSVAAFGVVCAACTASAPSPTVVGVEPLRVWNGAPTPVSISGERFYVGLRGPLEGRGSVQADARFVVMLDEAIGLDDVTWVSNEELQALVPADLQPRTYDMTVVRPDGEAAVLSSGVEVVDTLAPTIVGVEPSILPTDLDVEMLIAGSSLHPAATVLLSETSIPVLAVAGDLLITEVPAGLPPALYTLRVINPDGQSGAWPDGVQLVSRAVLPAMLSVEPRDVTWGDPTQVRLRVLNPTPTTAELELSLTVTGPFEVLATPSAMPIEPSDKELVDFWWTLTAVGEGAATVTVSGDGLRHRILPHTEPIVARRLVADLTVPAMVLVGEPLEVQLRITNAGPDVVASVTPDLVAVPAMGTGMFEGIPMPSASDLAVGASITFYFTYIFDALSVGMVTLTGQAQGSSVSGISTTSVVSVNIMVIP